MSRSLCCEAAVRFGQKGHGGLPEGCVARVEDGDPELLRVDGMGEPPVERGVVRLLDGACEGVPVSCSSVVTIVAKFGKWRSGSSEKNLAPRASTMSVSGQVSRIVRVIACGSGPVGRVSVVMS